MSFLTRGAEEPAQPTATGRDTQSGNVVSITETFDALPMHSRLPDPWEVRGDGPVEIAALPTSVDRSVRIAASEAGAATMACRPTPPAQSSLRIALDYKLGRPPAEDVYLIRLLSGGTSRVDLVVPVGGAALYAAAPGAAGSASGATAPPGASAAGRATSWQRVELRIAPDGTVSWQGFDVAGATAGTGSITVAAFRPGDVDTLCLSSPSGVPSAWVAVDDLVFQG